MGRCVHCGSVVNSKGYGDLPFNLSENVAKAALAYTKLQAKTWTDPQNVDMEQLSKLRLDLDRSLADYEHDMLETPRT